LWRHVLTNFRRRRLKVGLKQPDMLQASIESFKGDTSKLAALIRENLNTLDPDASTPAQGPEQMPPKPKLP